MSKSSIDHARRLEASGMERDLAENLVTVVEEIVGSPLSEAVFNARAETLEVRVVEQLRGLQHVLGHIRLETDYKIRLMDLKINHIHNEIESHLDRIDLQFNAMNERLTSTITSMQDREKTFESDVNAKFVNLRFWVMSGIATLLLIAIGYGLRLYWIGAI